MWKAYLKWDERVILSFQHSYLWLLDRTGIYVATLAFTEYLGAAASSLASGMNNWIALALVAFTGLALGHKYLMQDKAENERFNFVVLMMIKMKWRHPFNFFLLGCVLGDFIISQRWFSGLADIGFWAYGYFFLIMIRDRDKKPFFEKQEQLALEGAS